MVDPSLSTCLLAFRALNPYPLRSGEIAPRREGFDRPHTGTAGRAWAAISLHWRISLPRRAGFGGPHTGTAGRAGATAFAALADSLPRPRASAGHTLGRHAVPRQRYSLALQRRGAKMHFILSKARKYVCSSAKMHFSLSEKPLLLVKLEYQVHSGTSFSQNDDF
jgi:hypothetical protein